MAMKLLVYITQNIAGLHNLEYNDEEMLEKCSKIAILKKIKPNSMLMGGPIFDSLCTMGLFKLLKKNCYDMKNVQEL